MSAWAVTLTSFVEWFTLNDFETIILVNGNDKVNLALESGVNPECNRESIHPKRKTGHFCNYFGRPGISAIILSRVGISEHFPLKKKWLL